MIKVQRISEDGLSKEEWNFTISGTKLIYTSHFIYNRNNKREKWADEKPEPLIYAEWINKNDFEYFDSKAEFLYQKYLYNENPVRQKTRSGKTKLSGMSSSYIEHLPKCPKDVALEAKKKFCSELKVIYE